MHNIIHQFSDVQGQITLVFVVVFGRNSNSSKLSCMSSLPARMKMIESKMKELECSQDFSHYKSMGFFSRRSRASKSAVLGPIWPNFELVLDVMNVLVTYQYEEDPIKKRGASVFTTLYINFSDAQGQISLELAVVSGRIFFLIQAFMYVLVTCKNEDDRFKNEGARGFTRFLPL